MTANTVERAAEVLLKLGEGGVHGFGLMEIAGATGEARPTVHRTLCALVRHGFVERVGHGRYRLGSSIYGLARRESGAHDRVRRWRGALAALAEEFGHTTCLMSRAGLDAVVLDAHPGRGPVQAVTSGIGGRKPMGEGPGSIAILSLDPPDEQARIIAANAPRLRRHGLDPARIRGLVSQATRQGYALDLGELLNDCAGIALPILDRDGTVQMALSIVAPTPFFTPATVAKILARARVLVLNRPT